MIHGAGVVVVNKKGEVLMQHRDNKPTTFWPDYWCYPGGSVEINENFELAAKKELEEETNYITNILYPLVEENYKRTDGEVVRRHIFWTIYDEKQEIKCNEGSEMKFLKLEELKNKKLLPGQKRLCFLAVEQAKIKTLI
jgi:8-oxo-dGTP pyrophosphatase MutT (NUDIX family)